MDRSLVSSKVNSSWNERVLPSYCMEVMAVSGAMIFQFCTHYHKKNSPNVFFNLFAVTVSISYDVLFDDGMQQQQ